jgi:hypothetical protein
MAERSDKTFFRARRLQKELRPEYGRSAALYAYGGGHGAFFARGALFAAARVLLGAHFNTGGSALTDKSAGIFLATFCGYGGRGHAGCVGGHLLWSNVDDLWSVSRSLRSIVLAAPHSSGIPNRGHYSKHCAADRAPARAMDRCRPQVRGSFTWDRNCPDGGLAMAFAAQ